jgi:hypothetical protein
MESNSGPRNDCDIPGKCGFCGEHTYCVNAAIFKRTGQLAEEVIWWKIGFIITFMLAVIGLAHLWS